jgi:hypothetical protein
VHYYGHSPADVSRTATEVHKSGVGGAHRIRRPPCRERAGSDPFRRPFGLKGRADHLEKVFAALHVYLTAIIADTAHNIPGGSLDRRYLDNVFQDLSADALGVIRNAAEEMREHEIWRAS